MKPNELISMLETGGFDEKLLSFYGKNALEASRERYIKIVKEFVKLYGETDEISLFSAPGRTEIGGNHTDHNNGRVVAAAVNLDVVAAVAKKDGSIIEFASEGFAPATVSLNQLDPGDETGSSASLVRGIAKRFSQLGYSIGGFCAYAQSLVLKGSGLSSSASYEVLVGNILNGLYNNSEINAIEIAKIGQYAENVYFGKPSGLMDQMASSVGGFVAIDFADSEKPVVTPISLDFSSEGYTLCITDTGGNHEDLTSCYAAIQIEMASVAKYFGHSVLRQCTKEQLIENAADIRKKLGDRAFVRSYHFFCDDERAGMQKDALEKGDFKRFLSLVRKSGQSSISFLQNIYDSRNPSEQEIMTALALSEEFLGEDGAYRIHGGGFGGTIQAFVPAENAHAYAEFMEKTFGKGSCYRLFIRQDGGVKII